MSTEASNVVRLPLQPSRSAEADARALADASDNRAEVLFGIASHARECPAQFERMLVIVQDTESGKPVVWSRGMTAFQLGGLTAYCAHAFYQEALRE